MEGQTIPRMFSIPTCFEAHVDAAPDHWAVKTSNTALTYAALNAQANRIAWSLLDQYGDTSEPAVLLLTEGVPFITALLGVVKAGKCFVPVDPDHPQTRTRYVLEHTQTRLLITDTAHETLARTLAQPTCHVLNIDGLRQQATAANPAVPLTQEALASLLYTSGSTGQPKGVILDHGHWLHDLQVGNERLQVGAADHLSLLASGTGVAVKIIFRALLNGATLYPYPVQEEGITHLAAWLEHEAITIYQSGPSLFRNLLTTLRGHETFPALRLIRMGTAQLFKRDVDLYKQRFPRSCQLVNALASTEAGTFRLYFIDHSTQLVGETVPVGYAVGDKEVLILDEAGQEVGPHEVGTIAVRSAYLARGYWRQPELTHMAFQTAAHDARLRIYQTGDLGLLRPDGCLEYRGRTDTQVKVRGYRVEISEIEQALSRYPTVQEAVVLARADHPGEIRLVAYIVPTQQSASNVSVLQDFLRTLLPDYMLPTAFVFLETFPLLPTGKIDRQALPPPATTRPRLAQPFVSPRTPVEETLAQIWSEVLGLDMVGIHDDFLALGGHSLLAIQIVARVRSTWQFEISLRSLLEAATIATMALIIVHRLAEANGTEALNSLLTEVEGLTEHRT